MLTPPMSKPSSSCSTPPPEDNVSPTFPLFSRLPMELRRAIWQAGVYSIDPRIIPIEPDDEFEDAGRGFRCVARIGTPAIFSVCAESRAEAVKLYSLKFHAQLRQPIYFDREKDTLFMSRTCSLYSFLQSTYDLERITYEEVDRDEVRILALLITDTTLNHWGEDALHGYPSWWQVSAAARTFANLRALRLIYRQESNIYSLGFHDEKISLTDFWNRHWLKWQQQRAEVLQLQSIEPRLKTPKFTFWSREQLEKRLPTQERWQPENFTRRVRGSPIMYERNALAFFQQLP